LRVVLSQQGGYCISFRSKCFRFAPRVRESVFRQRIFIFPILGPPAPPSLTAQAARRAVASPAGQARRRSVPSAPRAMGNLPVRDAPAHPLPTARRVQFQRGFWAGLRMRDGNANGRKLALISRVRGGVSHNLGGTIRPWRPTGVIALLRCRPET